MKLVSGNASQASGTNGRAIYKALVASPANFKITFLTRPESEATFPEGHQIIRRAYDDPALVDELKGQDAVVCVISGMGILSQMSLIDAAAKAGVRKFMPSEVSPTFSLCLLPHGANTTSQVFIFEMRGGV